MKLFTKVIYVLIFLIVQIGPLSRFVPVDINILLVASLLPISYISLTEALVLAFTMGFIYDISTLGRSLEMTITLLIAVAIICWLRDRYLNYQNIFIRFISIVAVVLFWSFYHQLRLGDISLQRFIFLFVANLVANLLVAIIWHTLIKQKAVSHESN